MRQSFLTMLSSIFQKKKSSMSSHKSLAFQLGSVAKIENCFRSSFGTKVPLSVTLTICYKNPHDIESAKSKLRFYTRKSTKTVPYARPRLDPQTLINPYADLRLRFTHNSINFTTKIWKKSKFKNMMLLEKNTLTLTTEKKPQCSFFFFFFGGSQKKDIQKMRESFFTRLSSIFEKKKIIDVIRQFTSFSIRLGCQNRKLLSLFLRN